MIPGAALSPSRMLRPGWPAGEPVLALGAVVLGLVTSMMVAPGWQIVMLLILAGVLVRTGLSPGAQVLALRPWLPMALIVLAIHTFTTTSVAPLGHPSLGGVLAGFRALLRVSCTIAWLGLYVRITSLDDLVSAISWWLSPFRRWGLPIEQLGLVLAVALGTAPVVLGEGRRIETALRLRRCGPRRASTQVGPEAAMGPIRTWGRGQLDRIRVVVPLVESLARRTEALDLSLRARRPGPNHSANHNPPSWGLVLLGVWAVGLILSRWELV